MDFPRLFQEIASSVTAIGVCVGVLQLWISRRQAVTGFEDSLTNEYRQIAGCLPTAALLGDTLPDDQLQTYLQGFYFALRGKAFGLTAGAGEFPQASIDGSICRNFGSARLGRNLSRCFFSLSGAIQLKPPLRFLSR